MDARSAAARVLVQVFDDGRALGAALPPLLAELPDPRDRALLQDLCYGVLRGWPRLEAIAGELLRKPLGRRDSDIFCLIMVGLYQLGSTRIPPHAAVAGTVDATAQLGKAWARGLVNALLRRYQREAQQIDARVDADDANACAHPAWLLERLRRDWPQDWRAIAIANNQRPPMWLRVNLSRVSRDDYLEELSQAGFPARAAAQAGSAVRLEQPVDVARLPGFADGRVSVQDAAAQLAAGLLDVRPGHRVLDLCAAPGGKTCHILEAEPRLSALVAVDHDAARLERVGDNLARLGLDAELVCADAENGAASWWNGVAFDRILLDAPCSATGVIRRHPDIKRLRRPADLETMAATQSRLLDAAWSLLKDDGMLLYATCSIIHEENDEQIRRFVARHGDASERAIDAAWGRALQHGRQILPGEDDMDGFFYARIGRT
jgi:16S rRNA (cytosine967-C5)-methyltransferase